MSKEIDYGYLIHNKARIVDAEHTVPPQREGSRGEMVVYEWDHVPTYHAIDPSYPSYLLERKLDEDWFLADRVDTLTRIVETDPTLPFTAWEEKDDGTEVPVKGGTITDSKLLANLRNKAIFSLREELAQHGEIDRADRIIFQPPPKTEIINQINDSYNGV